MRQYQTRRRLMTSSSRSSGPSWPKRVGHGIQRRTSTSTKPRKTITTTSVASSAQYQAQPSCSLNQTKSTGLVRTATTVAARVSRRHWSASSIEGVGSAGVRPVSGSAVAIFRV